MSGIDWSRQPWWIQRASFERKVARRLVALESGWAVERWDLAESLKAGHKHLGRALLRLEDRGWVQRVGHSIQILDLEALRAFGDDRREEAEILARGTY